MSGNEIKKALNKKQYKLDNLIILLKNLKMNKNKQNL
jgi:hypothetical protein